MSEQAPPATPIAGPPPGAGISAADAMSLVSRTQQLEQDLAQERAQRARLETADRADKKAAAITSVLDGAPLVPGGAAQLATLLESSITLHTDPATGRTVAVGPGFVPAETHIRNELATKYPHFLRATNPQGGTAGGPSTQHAPTSQPWGGAPAKVPTTLLEAIVDIHERSPERTADPIYDLSQRFGLGGKR